MLNAAAADSTIRVLRGVANLPELQRRRPGRYPYLLQTVAGGGAKAGYDILMAFPSAGLTLQPDGRLSSTLPGAVVGNGFLDALDGWWQRECIPTPDSALRHLPFRGGWFVFFAYELAAEIEPVLHLQPDENLPLAWATRIPAAVICDHAHGSTTLMAEPGHVERLEQMQSDLRAPPVFTADSRPLLAAPLAEEEPQRYLHAVERARDYIRDGDIFQANLSRQWQAPLRTDAAAADIYQRLCHANPAPFAALAIHGDSAIISSSPERLLRVRAGRAETRPIAGTRPRGVDRARDAALVHELLANPKERAEHVMLLDLERNDLGRVCRTGSVRVDELMTIESYAHVHHIVSNVSGKLRADVTPGQVLRAVFPGGTITGCPKVRCMQIIAELEAAPRGAYTGSLGYLNRDGDLDLNILIRTLVKNGAQLQFRAGAGIVADSVPERELQETRAKARGLARALGTDA
ncbi:MAG TPA: aminodeoxychorismate synthase component I [Gammaproteobacteria bacterium]|nr:aminodeoxychorismate synthase component I [Gammaproteobacteria bacterium]